MRLQDFNEGGHIISAYNIPLDNFSDPGILHRIVERVSSNHVKKIVVHCMMSQVRGPKAARILAKALHDEGHTLPEVFVLRRGFSMFASLFKGDPELITHRVMDGYNFV